MRRRAPVVVLGPTPKECAALSTVTAASLTAQADRLVDLGIPDLAGITAADLHAHAAELRDGFEDGSLLVVHPGLVAASRLAPLLERDGREGFVVEDLTDLDEFVPVASASVPDRPLYLVHGVERGDDLLGRSPEEAMATLRERARTPLTISEGICWVLQDPSRLEPGRCFMCIASRKPRAGGGLDARTPAIWISGGTGRDGRERRGAPKIGWCWARNRHSWLGFASATGRGPFA